MVKLLKIAGPDKSGKTTAALMLVLAMLQGFQKKVGFIALEDTIESLLMRAKQAFGGDTKIKQGLFLSAPVDRRMDEVLDQVKYLAESGATYIVIDGLSNIIYEPRPETFTKLMESLDTLSEELKIEDLTIVLTVRTYLAR